MMLEPLTPADFVRYTLLLAVRDGSDRLVFRPINEYSCQEFAWVAGEQFEMIPPSLHDLQALPAELARLRPAGWLWRVASWVRWPRGGSFVYPIGSGSVPVAYQVRWQAGRVSELEITVGVAPELVEAAQAGLRVLFPPLPDDPDYPEQRHAPGTLGDPK